MPTRDRQQPKLPRAVRYGSPLTAPKGNLAVQQVLAAARLFADDGYPEHARLLRAVVNDYQEAAAKRFYEGEATA